MMKAGTSLHRSSLYSCRQELSWGAHERMLQRLQRTIANFLKHAWDASYLDHDAESCPVRKIVQMQGRQACLKPVVQHLFEFSGQL